MKDKKKLLIKSIIYAAVAFFMMAASVFAWFYQSRDLGSIILDSDEKKKCDAALYEFFYTPADYSAGETITFEYVRDREEQFDDITEQDNVMGGYNLIPGFDRYFRLDLELEEGTSAQAMIYLADITLRVSQNIDSYKDFILLNILDDSDEDDLTVDSVKLFEEGVIAPDANLVNLAVLKESFLMVQGTSYSIYFSIGLDTDANIEVTPDPQFVFSVKHIYIRY